MYVLSSLRTMIVADFRFLSSRFGRGGRRCSFRSLCAQRGGHLIQTQGWNDGEIKSRMHTEMELMLIPMLGEGITIMVDEGTVALNELASSCHEPPAWRTLRHLHSQSYSAPIDFTTLITHSAGGRRNDLARSKMHKNPKRRHAQQRCGRYFEADREVGRRL